MAARCSASSTSRCSPRRAGFGLIDGGHGGDARSLGPVHRRRPDRRSRSRRRSSCCARPGGCCSCAGWSCRTTRRSRASRARSASRATAMITVLLARYEALVAAGELRARPEQRARRRAARPARHATAKRRPKRGSILVARARRASPKSPRGVYLWGGVGRGKSMLMDLFFGCLDIRRKRRVHFHEFMLEVHERLRRGAVRRKRAIRSRRSPQAIAEETRLLAFDEMVVNNSRRRDDPVAAVHRADRRQA